ncbi:MAG: GNAT family N-acetyltransferase [Phyllobacterium sp.]
MALTEPISIRKLSEDDLAEAMELSSEASWNQVEADWQLFIKLGNVFGIKVDGVLVATAATMPYGDELAWIGMVLTRKIWRGNGFGTSLLKHCVTFLEKDNRVPFLDATPAGEPIYRALGFESVFSLTRWQGNGGNTNSKARRSNPDAAIAQANAAFGADRRALLSNFAARRPDLAVSSHSGAVGFGRNGRVATQIGPVIANNAGDGADLIADMISTLSGPVFLDVNDRCTLVAERLNTMGFLRQRPFLRMRKGRTRTPIDDIRTVAIAGPEFG